MGGEILKPPKMHPSIIENNPYGSRGLIKAF